MQLRGCAFLTCTAWPTIIPIASISNGVRRRGKLRGVRRRGRLRGVRKRSRLRGDRRHGRLRGASRNRALRENKLVAFMPIAFV